MKTQNIVIISHKNHQLILKLIKIMVFLIIYIPIIKIHAKIKI